TLPETEVRGSEVRLKPHGARFMVHAFGREMGEVEIQVPGRHNVLNALATVAVGLEIGVGFGHIAESLAGFRGVGRRFETRGAAGARHLSFAASPAEAVAAAAAEARPGDVVLTLGAGDVWKLGDDILRRLRHTAGVTEGRG